ncbi:MAG: isoleucine--tRNA ligase [Candidatus Aminicenantes bacterium]|nr:isoleucine--tRNA ligase [Candidatus Aminicenantes bacterium]
MPDAPDYKDTLHLPRTDFAMKAKLPQREPEILKMWEEEGLYDKILKKGTGRPAFVLHDGPPYANGHIHLGTALNKILKDFIVKSRTMMGFQTAYLPGWDCHGLPIEIKVDQKLGEKKKNMSVIEFREECARYAKTFIDIQRREFKRLGVLGEWEAPYLTMDPVYEGQVLRHLAAFFRSGNVYKGKRPVHWCPSCRTALAEAEIEYRERRSPSIYVRFPVVSDLAPLSPGLKGRKASVLIWTTTPWTLPANLAIAFHPDYEYVAFEADGEVLIAAKRLVPLIVEELGLKTSGILAEFKGAELKGLKARHPFIDRESVFVLASYVTLDTGTGAVHTAPGHGQEDYATGVECGLEVYAPVDEEGRFTSEVERYAGVNVFEANRLIMDDMEKDGSLAGRGEITHSYPHCWRCKNPVIFRATDQWFISLDAAGLRDKALEEVRRVTWIPSWGRERIANMLINRPDWCISRQRLWGVPLPAFSCRACGRVLADEEICLRAADIFSREGSNSWFLKPGREFLPPGRVCPGCGSADLTKESNILDVWFESGASHNVLDARPELPWPSDVYIEGHDQYRGWFNSSLLVGVAARGRAPYETVITHGFILDETGRAMSKSQGNVIDPGEIISQNGAEVLRLWVAMLDFKEDARFGREIMARIIEAYRKLRNTWRFLLGNLFDFDPERHAVGRKDLLVLDRWALQKTAEVGRRVLQAYRDYEYHVVFHALSEFFSVELSSLYLDVLKDRLYCSAENSPGRRSAQTALHGILRATLLLMAPVLPFTTEDAWRLAPPGPGGRKAESIHLEDFPSFRETWIEDDERRSLESVLGVRERILKELEKAREEKRLGNALEARVFLRAPESLRGPLESFRDDLPPLFIVSDVGLEFHSGPDLEVLVEKAPGRKCRRCWMFSDEVGKNADHPDLCRRCWEVLKEQRS